MKFIHTADIHLDSPLSGLAAYKDAPADLLRTVTRDAFNRQKSGWDQLEPAEPVTRSPTMRGNDQNFNVRTHLPIEDVVGETWYTVATNTGRKFNAVSIRHFTDLAHCCIEGRQITCAESNLASLVVGHMLKVFNSRCVIEEVTHLSKASAWRRTSSDGMRLESPWSISAARCAASCNQRGSISASDSASRLDKGCAANSARSRTGSDNASVRMVSVFMNES